MLSISTIYPVNFSDVGHTAMAAEAPDLHKGDLGRLEEVRKNLTGADMTGHRLRTE